MKKVLIVEDDLIIALSAEKMIQRLGLEVLKVVDTGEKAVETALNNKPDIILMDIRLAGEMDGVEAAFRIREELSKPRIIFVTGNADPGYRTKAEGTGYEAYLVKPIRLEDLRKIIG
ncbi:response regulator [Rhodohalobacter mucosus]|uniref:Response regulator n=1 Tax=Rhodohalobacter mucosus TaxID=2079485 RepID=A0A316TR87_9BACT|nr:response regulator [Rhodohalobacter mucosus]PWN06930.1 response regulator [Rhodohalobacter mucosus]